MASRSHISLLLLLYSFVCLFFSSFCRCITLPALTIDSLRVSLEKQEDFILFSLFERARYPYDSFVYDSSYFGKQNCSFVEQYVRETEIMEAKFGRYQNLEELPFFPDDIQPNLVSPHIFPHILYPPAASVNVSKSIWGIYFNDLLPLFTTKGNDGNYQQAAASDLICLQALSRRIHSGRFAAEIKFRDAPQNYIPAIQAKDSEALMKLLTFPSVEVAVVERVFKKAEIFGQDINLGKNATEAQIKGKGIKYKVEPSVVSKLYREWVIPLTKQVEVDYLLCHQN